MDMLRRVQSVLAGDGSLAAPMLAWAIEQIEEHEQSFELRWEADMRAIQRWQDAHPGKERTWPDHADLCVWLLEKLYGLPTDTDHCVAAMSHALEVLREKEPDGCRCGAFMRPIAEQLERAIADHRADIDPEDSVAVPAWLVIGWEVKRAATDVRCFNTEEGAHDFIGSFRDPNRWVPLYGPELITRGVKLP